ncbi:sugar phosphate nucleotidyltransferase [Pseudomonas lini]
MELIPVILSGGVGSRLWPVSREAHPKPFMDLPDGQNLIQKNFPSCFASGRCCGGSYGDQPGTPVQDRRRVRRSQHAQTFARFHP